MTSLGTMVSSGFNYLGGTQTSTQPRGLYNFILEIRNSPTKEEERSRVDKELANIRQKFATSSNLSSYQKKKYVWKMCYIYMLGYDVDFGHLECISLISSSKFQEKAVGYMAVVLLLRPGDELIKLVINSIHNDIVGNDHAGQTLALAAVANIGGNEFGEALMSDVQKLVRAPRKEPPEYLDAMNMTYEEYWSKECLTAKKAILCLLRLFRNAPDGLVMDGWPERVHTVLECDDWGVKTSAMSLATALASHDPHSFQILVPVVLETLGKLRHKDYKVDYKYYKVASPWLQVKCLKFLQYYQIPPERRDQEAIFDSIEKILTKGESSENSNQKNAENAVLFEAVNLIIAYGTEVDPVYRVQALSLLGKYIALKDANIRFLGLCAMTTLVKINGPEEVLDHLSTVVDACKDADASVAKKSMDLLFVMTRESNVKTVVEELLIMLTTSAESLKEEIVVKIAILAETYNSDMAWYVDTLVQVVLSAAAHVSDDVWYRVVQVVANHPDVQRYASARLLMAVRSKVAHETTVALAGYVLGEFGVSISAEAESSGYEQFCALHQHFGSVSTRVQALLLTSYAKLMNLYPDAKPAVEEVLSKMSTSTVLELQQRACEYLRLSALGADVMETVLDQMPQYSEDKASLLLSRMHKNEAQTTDRVWQLAPKQSDDEPTPVSTGPVFTPPTKPKVVDLLSLDDDNAEEEVSPFSPGISRNTTKLTAAETADARKKHVAFSRLASGQRGIIFENDTVRVSASAEYRAYQGRVAVFVLNKTSASLSSLGVTLPVVDFLTLKKQDPGTTVQPNEEAKLLLAVDCVKPFVDVPDFTIDFNSPPGTCSYTLPLPLSIAAFAEPIVVEKADYMARWKSLEGEDREVQEVFAAAPNMPMSADLMAKVRASLFPALHLGLAPGLDSDTTATACCSLRTGTLAQDGVTPVSVGTMLRLEADLGSGRYRITVRAKHPTVAHAFKALVKSHLG